MDTSKHGPATGGAAPAAAAAAQDDGVTRWTVTRLSLIDALRRGWPDLPLAILARSADTVLAQLDSGGESVTGETASTEALASLAEALDRRAGRADASSLTREGSIRGRAFREAAEMARARAGAPPGRPGASAPVSLDPESGSGALWAAQDGPAEYRKRPGEPIKAMRWTGSNIAELREFAERATALIEHQDGDTLAVVQSGPPNFSELGVLEPGDWLAADTTHLPWSLTAAEFDATYEPVDPDSDLTEDGWPL